MSDLIHEGEKKREAPASEKPVTERERQRRVYVYITVLFTAALLLIVWSFLAQHRSNQAVIDEVRGSTDIMQSTIEENDSLEAQNAALAGENEALLAQVETLEEALDEANKQLDVLPDVISHQEHTLAMTAEAMDWFWQINEAYACGRQALCRTLIAQMEGLHGGSLPSYLPAESVTNTGRFSPAERYAEICGAVK